MTANLPTDAEAFHAFLTVQLHRGGRNQTPEDLLAVWRAEHAETIDDIRQGMLDLEAGRVRPLREVDEELRNKYNIAREA